MRLRYRTEAGQESDRTVWPVILGYAETSRIVPKADVAQNCVKLAFIRKS
jgi:hypothetical protein